MTNQLINLTADGTFQTLGAALGFPQEATAVSIQARPGQVDVYYRWINNTAGVYWTIKAGTVRSIQGRFQQGELQVLAVADTVIEIEISTQLTI